jgi:hypothetical protein
MLRRIWSASARFGHGSSSRGLMGCCGSGPRPNISLPHGFPSSPGRHPHTALRHRRIASLCRLKLLICPRWPNSRARDGPSRRTSRCGSSYLRSGPGPHRTWVADRSTRWVENSRDGVVPERAPWCSTSPKPPCRTFSKPPPPRPGGRNRAAATSASASSNQAWYRPNSSATSKPPSTSTWRPGSPMSNNCTLTTSPKPSPTSSPAPAAEP